MPNADTIDERVVEMRIDNRQFVKGANQTIGVLDKLKEALSFKKATKGFDDISKAANNVDLGGLTTMVNEIDRKLEYLGSKTRMFMENLIRDIYGKGKQLLQSLTSDQITAGWSKYDNMTQSIHTIMGATADSWEQTLERISRDYGFVGSQLDFVNQQLDRMLWFTDETSASFTDMTSNVGKWTNIGFELDEAAIAMMGVATWGYKAGAGINEQARAMYNLSQAAGMGKVTMIDWKSIENANMATMEFKNIVLEEAAAAGTLRKEIDGTYRTIAKGTEVTATNFRDALSEGFFTSDVLMASLYKYGHFASLMEQVVSDTGLSTRDLMSLVKDYKDGVFDAEKAVSELYKTYGKETPSVEALTYAMELLGQEEDDIGYAAFKASQETKTLAEAIEYTKDAVSSGWMKTWQYIVGDYDEAKELWTNVTDELYELFVKAGERRNAILSVWKDEGGRDALLEALGNVYRAIMNLISPIQKAFKTIFGLGEVDEAGSKLYQLTVKFKEFTERLTISEDTLKGMEVFFTKFFEKVKIVLSYAKKALSIFGKVFGYITRIFGAFFRAFSSGEFDANQFLSEMNDIIGDIGEKLKNAWEKVKQFVDSLQDIPVVGPVLKFLVNVLEKIWGIFGWIIDKIKGIKIETEGVQGPWDKISGTFTKIGEKIQNIDIDTKKLSGTFQKISDFFGALWEGLVGDPEEFKKTVKNFFSNAFAGLVEAVKEIDFEKLLQATKIGIFTYIGIQFANMLAQMTRTVKQIENIPQAIAGVFTSMQDVFRSFSKSINANIYIKIALAVALLAASVLMLSQIDDNKFVMVALTLVTMFALLAKAAKSLDGAKMFADNGDKATVLIKGFSKAAMMIIAMAAFLAAATYAIKEISSLSTGEIIKGLAVIAIICLLAYTAMKRMSDVMNDEQGNLKSLLKLTAISAAIAAAGKAIAKLAVLPITGVIAASLALMAVLYVASLIVEQAAKFEGKGAGAVATILALVVAIYALTIPLVLIATTIKAVGWAVLYAVGILVLLMAAIAGFMWVGGKIGEMKGLVTFSLTLIAVAAAMLVMAIATAVFVPALASLVAILVSFMAIISKMDDFGTVAGRLAILGAALLPIAIVLVLVGVAALTFGAGLLAAALGVNMFVKGILKFAIAIALIAAAAKMFVQTIDMLVTMIADNGDKIIKTLEWLLLTVIGLFVTYKMAVANAALTIVLAIITVLANVGGSELINTLNAILNKVFIFLGTAIGSIVEFLVGFVVYILKRLADALEANRQALAVQVERIIGILISLVVEIGLRLLGDVLQLFWGGIQDAINSIFGTKLDFNVADAFSGVARDVGTYISSTFDHSDELENAGGTLDDKIAEGATENGGTVVDAIKGVISNGNSVVDDNNNDNAPILGGNFDIGIANGIEDHIPDVTGSINNLTGAMTGQFMTNLDMHSPSKLAVSFGRFWDLGIAFGVKDNLGEVTEANDDLTTLMQTALMNAMSIIGRIADEDLSIKPVVKPVVDMTDVSSASSMMSGMFGAYSSMDLGAINARVSAAAEGASAAASSMDAFGEASSSNDSFVINVYSQPGMDENDLANAVMYKIQNGILRKGAALG